jgi:protein-S-isoprenylcysteine O-methyltransferase Ste14
MTKREKHPHTHKALNAIAREDRFLHAGKTMMEEELSFRVAFLLVCSSLLAVRAYYALRGQSANKRASWRENWKELVEYEGTLSVVLRKTVFPLWISSLVVFAAFPSWLNWASLPFPAWLRWLEVCFAAVCLPLLMWVQHTLGHHWSTQLRLRINHTLVTSGLYRWIRHPMYTVLFVLRLAIALATANALILLIEGTQFALYYARIGKEEQMLLHRFGEEYRVYMMRTGRFLPRLATRHA